MVVRLKELEDKSRRLKKMCAEVRLKAEIFQEGIAKSGEAVLA
jgi:putative transposase